MTELGERILAYLGAHETASAHTLETALGIPHKTLYRCLAGLLVQGRIAKAGTPPVVAYALVGSEKLAQKQEAAGDPPLVSLKITNPVTYLKLWWKKVMANEGVDIRFRVHPLTAMAIVTALVTAGVGVGRFTLPASNPIVRYVPQLGPTPTPNPWKDTAFTGVLRYTAATERYYLATGDGEAITLQVPARVNMAKLVGKRIFATGRLNIVTHVLQVAATEDLEILPNYVVPVPTTSDVVPVVATGSGVRN